MSITDLLLLVFGVLFIMGMIVYYILEWKYDEKLYQEEKKRKNLEAEKLNRVDELQDRIEDLLEKFEDMNENMEYLFKKIHQMERS